MIVICPICQKPFSEHDRFMIEMCYIIARMAPGAWSPEELAAIDEAYCVFVPGSSRVFS